MLRAIELAVVLAVATQPATGPVTVRFRNTNAFPVYVEVTWSDGVQWPFPVRTDTQPCSAGCNCFSISRPAPVTRAIPPGGVLESTWNGAYVDVRSCEGSGPPGGSCRCHSAQQAAAGRYAASFAGARGQRVVQPPAQPAGELTEGAEPDEAKGRCEARVEFELGTAPRTVEAPITCAGAGR